MNWPEGKYRLIYMDPPWKYQNWSDAKNGAARAHYDCMTAEEMCELPVDQLADPSGCALAMWIVGPKLVEGEHLQLLDAWGFKPVTMLFVWNKVNRQGNPYCGIGFYTRSATEFCLLARRGKISRRKTATKVMQVITAPRIYRHSAKPEETYDRLEELFEGPYLEIFARNTRPGWQSWGNDPAVRE